MNDIALHKNQREEMSKPYPYDIALHKNHEFFSRYPPSDDDVSYETYLKTCENQRQINMCLRIWNIFCECRCGCSEDGL